MILLPALPLLILLAGVILEIVLGRALTTRGKGWLALGCGLGALAGVLAMLPGVSQGQIFQYELFRWDASSPFLLYVDPLGLLFALMAAGIGSAILLYCIDYMAHEPFGVTRFYALMLTFIAGLISLVFSANLLMAYLSWEVIGLCSYFLVGFWYQDPAAAGGARKVLLMTHLPGYGLLIAILILYQNSGTFLWTDPALAAHFTGGLFLLMLVAAMAKSVMFPLHTWIPEAMNAPTPVSALLHSACYVKAGIYLIARMYSFTQGQPWPVSWSTLVMAVGCVTMLVGALFALAQTDLKRLLAFSTISQLGYIVAAIGLGPVYGMYAAMFYTFSHGLFKGTLFLCAGAVQHAAGTRDMRQLGGLAQRMPRTALIWLVAAASIIGVPLTNGFFAKWLVFDAALREGQWVVLVVAWLVSIITAFYILKATVSVFYGDLPDTLRDPGVADPPARMQVGMGVLAGLCLLFGILPMLVTRWISGPAAVAASVAQKGLPLPQQVASLSGLPSVLGAVVVIAALLFGLILWGVSRLGSSARAVNTFTGGDPLPPPATAGAEDFADLAATALAPVYRLANPDPLYLRVWDWIQALAGWVGRAAASLEARPMLSTLAIAAVFLVIAWLVA